MAAQSGRRVEALDVLRGLAVAGMILVVSPGDWAAAYPQLQHAAWNGATAADMVFPTFLFGVGMALGLSFPRAMDEPAARRIFRVRLLRRATALILLGLAVEASYVLAIAWGAPEPFPGGLSHLRIPGILQRIGICYALAGIAIVATANRDGEGRAAIAPVRLAAVGIAVLVGYWALLRFVPVPGHGAGHLDEAGNLPGYIDRTIFTPAHLWPLGAKTWLAPPTYDPEGLLSSLPATVDALFGALAAWAWRRGPERSPLAIAAAGIALIAAGLLLDPVFAINKRIWTSSFALFSGGVSATLLAALIVVLRRPAAAIGLTPLRVLGGNAILAFLLSTLVSRIDMVPFAAGAGQPVTLRTWGYDAAQAIIPDRGLASLACAVAVLALITLILWPLHRRALHFRI